MEKLHIIDKIKFFQGLTDSEKKALSEIDLRIFKFDTRQEVVRIKQQEAHLYIIIKGSATVVNADKEPVAILKGGEVFGEVSFLGGRPRTATVVANNELIVMRVAKEAFQTLEPALREKLKDSLITIVIDRLFSCCSQENKLDLSTSFDWTSG